MIKNSLLTDVTIIDFSTRLPGPFSTYILESFGAKIIKIENSAKGGDPFTQPEYLAYAPAFKDWYQNLNQEKEIIQIDFKQGFARIKQLVSQAQIIIVPDSKSTNELLASLSHETSSTAIIKLSGGTGEWKNLHDLNALAMTKTFSTHLGSQVSPPYLPFAGIGFAQYIATYALALLRNVELKSRSITKTLYLKDTTEFIFDALYSELESSPGKYLHNGAFPCYQVYLNKNNDFVCVAAVEERYWQNLQDQFSLQLTVDDRFDTSGKTIQILQNLFANYTTDEINNRLENSNSCISIVINK